MRMHHRFLGDLRQRLREHHHGHRHACEAAFADGFGEHRAHCIGRGGRGGRFASFGDGQHAGGEDLGGWNDLRGGGRRGGGRMFGHGDLRLLLLALIEQQPRHGYELIRIIGDMFHGQYTPSPGAIYPTLTLLEELGHAEVQPEPGSRKLYAITELGRAFLDENRAAVDAVMAQTERSARMAARMALPENVRNGMSAVKHALLMRGTEWNKAESRRIAEILQRAASEIVGGRTP